MKSSQVLEMKNVQQMSMNEMKELNGGFIPSIIVGGASLVAALVSTKTSVGIAIVFLYIYITKMIFKK